MAKIEILAPVILSWEGGYVDDPHDRGGATNKGVTIGTWRQAGYDKDGDGDIDTADLKLITEADAVSRVMKPHYWDRWKADAIRSQSVANMLVDWVWASGAHGIKIPQRMLGVDADGIVGPRTLAAVNSRDPQTLLGQLRARREEFIDIICRKNPTQERFRKGWLRRLDGIGYGWLRHNGGAVHRPSLLNISQPPRLLSQSYAPFCL